VEQSAKLLQIASQINVIQMQNVYLGFHVVAINASIQFLVLQVRLQLNAKIPMMVVQKTKSIKSVVEHLASLPQNVNLSKIALMTKIVLDYLETSELVVTINV
jgi:hypothetical protein